MKDRSVVPQSRGSGCSAGCFVGLHVAYMYETFTKHFDYISIKLINKVMGDCKYYGSKL